jgi:hypothetical protein
MKKIVYVGLKEIKGDNVAQTGLTWARGQVRDVVDDAKAVLLLKHPLIWQDASGKNEKEIAALLLPEFKAVAPIPAVNVVAEGAAVWDPFTVPVPNDVLGKVRAGELIPVFMTEADADGYADWKKMEADTAPKNTGPKPQAKETKMGLDTKPKAA